LQPLVHLSGFTGIQFALQKHAHGKKKLLERNFWEDKQGGQYDFTSITTTRFILVIQNAADPVERA